MCSLFVKVRDPSDKDIAQRGASSRYPLGVMLMTAARG